MNGSQELVSSLKKKEKKREKKLQAHDEHCITTKHNTFLKQHSQSSCTAWTKVLCSFRKCDTFWRRQCHRPKQLQWEKKSQEMRKDSVCRSLQKSMRGLKSLHTVSMKLIKRVDGWILLGYQGNKKNPNSYGTHLSYSDPQLIKIVKYKPIAFTFKE